MSHRQYEVQITPAARKELDNLPKQQQEKVEESIAALASNPRPAGCLKLQGVENTYRIRVGNCRILYQIYDKVLVVLVVKIGDRKDIYRK